MAVSLDPSSLEGLTDSERTIGGTRFLFDKGAAMETFDIFEQIREAAGDKLDLQGTGRLDLSILKMILFLPRSFIKTLRHQMFAFVRFTNANVKTPVVLQGMEDTAFDGLELLAVYEVLVRSLAVNFTPSFRGIIEVISLPEGQPSRQSAPD